MSSLEASSHEPAPSVRSVPVAVLGAVGTETVSPDGARGAPSAPEEQPRRVLTRAGLRALLARVLGEAFPDARAELFVTDAEGNLSPVSELGVARIGPRSLLAALRSRALDAHRDLTEARTFPALPEPGARAAMSAPLFDDAGAFIGLVALERGPGGAGFVPGDLHVLEELATLIAPAVQQTFRNERSRQVRRELDLRAACRVQRRLMNGTLPLGVGVTSVVEYRPALGVGGDFYSVRHLGGGRISVAIGDVSGNGVAAALLMSRVASDIERALGRGEPPSAVLGAVNEDLADSENELFVTACCLQLDTASRTMTVSNAGHLPILVRRVPGEVFTCAGASGTPLGVRRCDYDDQEIALQPNDIVLLATDGLLEALDHPTGFRGLERAIDLVRAGPHDARALHARLGDAADEARRAHDLDDVTWVGLQLAP